MARARAEGADARFAALLAVGALALHQLRYVVADGPHAAAALERTGHAYLGTLLAPLLAVAVALVVVSFARAALDRAPTRVRLAGRYVAAFTGGLLAIFSAQELLEGVLASGHPAGLGALIAAGGWVALPIAAAIAVVLAGLATLLDRAEIRIADKRRRRAPRLRAPRKTSPRNAPAVARLSLQNLVFGFSRRPPPVSLGA